MLAPAVLALSLAVAVALTIAGPAAATTNSLTVTATSTADDGSTISITASGTGGPNDFVYVFVNNADTPCAATPQAEQAIVDSRDQPYPSASSASGSFSFMTNASFESRPGARIVCGYVGGLYSSSISAGSDTTTAYPCPPDTSFTISGIKIATGENTDKQGAVQSRWAFTDFTVQTTFPPYSIEGGTPAQQGWITDSVADDSPATYKTVSAMVDKVRVSDDKVAKTGGTDTYTILFYPYADPGSCTKADGTVVGLGIGPNEYHAPAQTLKVTYGAACQGGTTATLDGQTVPVTNESATTKPQGEVEPCGGLSQPKPGAKSGKCTRKTKLAKGYICRHHRVVKKR